MSEPKDLGTGRNRGLQIISLAGPAGFGDEPVGRVLCRGVETVIRVSPLRVHRLVSMPIRTWNAVHGALQEVGGLQAKEFRNQTLTMICPAQSVCPKGAQAARPMVRRAAARLAEPPVLNGEEIGKPYVTVLTLGPTALRSGQIASKFPPKATGMGGSLACLALRRCSGDY